MRLKLVLAALGLLLAVPVALAAQETIEDVELEAGGDARFDPANDDVGNDDCLTADIREEDAYTPVEDGFIDSGSSDAFDDGVLLLVNGKSFVDADGNGNLTGQQLKVGPSTMSGLKVTRTDRALATPTLRSLISFKNPKNKAKKVSVLIQNDYGADDDEVVRASDKAPNLFYSKSDIWVVIADDATSPGDTVVTHAFFGKGANTKVNKVTNGIPNEDSCLHVRYSVKVPGKSKRHLMLFTQLHETDEVGLARQRAGAFSKAKLGKKFLTGLSKGTKAKVVNWDLK